MTEEVCRERLRLFAGHVGLSVFFIEPGELRENSPLGAVFTLEDYDSEMQAIDPDAATDTTLQAVIERARLDLAEHCGCEIVHTGAGHFRCLRHDVDCDIGEEQDAVIRQTLRWTVCCPVGDITQAFFLPPKPHTS